MGQYADTPSCCKCGAKAPLSRPEYVYHESHYHSRNIGEHIHLCCRRCNYKWTMAHADTTGTKWYEKPPLGRSNSINKVGSVTDSAGRLLVPGSLHKVDSIKAMGQQALVETYNERHVGRLLVPGMSSYQENSERFEEKDESPSHKVGWRKPKGLFDVD